MSVEYRNFHATVSAEKPSLLILSNEKVVCLIDMMKLKESSALDEALIKTVSQRETTCAGFLFNKTEKMIKKVKLTFDG